MTQISQQIGKYRWTICALAFFATGCGRVGIEFKT
jgi:hypothetical protein